MLKNDVSRERRLPMKAYRTRRSARRAPGRCQYGLYDRNVVNFLNI